MFIASNLGALMKQINAILFLSLAMVGCQLSCQADTYQAIDGSLRGPVDGSPSTSAATPDAELRGSPDNTVATGASSNSAPDNSVKAESTNPNQVKGKPSAVGAAAGITDRTVKTGAGMTDRVAKTGVGVTDRVAKTGAGMTDRVAKTGVGLTDKAIKVPAKVLKSIF
jgi:hypothetical protein